MEPYRPSTLAADMRWLLYIMGQDQAEFRAINRRISDDCIGQSRDTMQRSWALLDRLRDKEAAEATHHFP
jgi:hypothetical protein